jgi:hypothetical protein
MSDDPYVPEHGAYPVDQGRGVIAHDRQTRAVAGAVGGKGAMTNAPPGLNADRIFSM